MKNTGFSLEKTTNLITKLLIVAVPLFFLPITREFVIITKMYFFIYAAVVLALLAFVGMIITKKITWKRDTVVNGLFLLIIGMGLSIVIMAPNKMAALFLPHLGLIPMVAMLIYYFFLRMLGSDTEKSIAFYSGIGGFVAAIISIIFYIQPFRALELPAQLVFLQSPIFNTVGSQIDLLVYYAFVLICMFTLIRSGQSSPTPAASHAHGSTPATSASKSPVFYYVIVGVVAMGAVVGLFEIFRVVFIAQEGLLIAPFGIAWDAAIDILKNPFTALFGVGVGNYAAIFTQVKDVAYNLGDLWQISSFNVASSGLLHVWTTTGIIGTAGVALIVSFIVRNFKNATQMGKMLSVLSIASFVLLPPSFLVWFLWVVSTAVFANGLASDENKAYEADLSRVMPVYIIAIVVFAIFLGGITFFTSTTVASEVMFKQALDSVARNDARGLYDLQRQAIIVNPYNEEFRRSFAQTNLIVANNLASRNPEEITDQDRDTITQAIQAAISEAKAAVALNPQKVNNWQYLASVYRNIINVAQGADLWTIAALQRAILLDPQNPVYRLDLGGVYFLLESYDDAQRLFEQAVSLKPDWGNAHYNLSWTYFRQENYAAAVRQMEITISLLDRETQAADYERAVEDLNTFREALETAQAEAADAAEAAGQGADAEGAAQADDAVGTPQEGQEAEPELELPSSPEATLDEQIELGEEASPSAGLDDAGFPVSNINQ